VFTFAVALLPAGYAVQTGVNGQENSGEIFCAGSVRYAMSGGQWLSKTQGTAPIVLPLKVETTEAAGRVTVPGLGIIEGQKNTLFTLERSKDGEIILTVARGTVLYSLNSKARLRFISPIPHVESLIGCTSATKSFQWTPGNSLLGEISVESANAFHIFTLNGETVIRHEGKAARSVAAGRALQVIHLNSQEPDPANDFKLTFMPLPDGGRLVFKDQVMPNNWNLATQYPQPATPVKKWGAPPAAISGDYLGGGYRGHAGHDSDDDHHHPDDPDRPPPQDPTPTVPGL
jgi:hypothetical protein